MKHGFMDMMWTWNCSHHNGLEKICRDKNGAAGQVEHKRHVTVFFISRMLCIMNPYFRGKQWIAGIILKCRNILEKMLGEKDPSCGEQLLVLPSWQCASSFIATDSWLFVQHEHSCASSATLLTWPADFSLFPKLKSTLKGQWFQTIHEITENSHTELHTIPK
jgi:hypothetical protein